MTVLAVFVLGGTADADSHFEKVVTYNNKIYALRTNEVSYTWYPSEIVELDADLIVQRTRTLNDGTNAAKNSLSLALHGNKLYVGSVGGGMMGGEAGDVWEVNITTWTASQVLDVSGINEGIYGLAIQETVGAPVTDMVFLLGGYYDASYPFDFHANLYITDVNTLTGPGSLPTGIPIVPTTNGYSWNIAWSESEQILWVMAGTELQAYDVTTNSFTTFSPITLGGNIESIAVLDGVGLFYTANTGYTEPSLLGKITYNGGVFSTPQQLVANIGNGDAAVFAFRDHNKAPRVLVREYNYGPNDNVYIYDAAGAFVSPIVNESNWGSNIHAITTLGNYLYLGTYESYSGSSTQLSGEIKRVDMSGWPTFSWVGGGGGGGCDAGFGGAALLLLLIPIALRKNRKK
ncbi:MAG: SYNERG-CTERM sorting domain-containing protein [Synergistaceae bacterium]|nr:SYNERG-CTERM sorting domain-containing protein [Synergistaceae bacterium]